MITLKDTSSNISIDPLTFPFPKIGLLSLHKQKFIKFSHKPVYPIMVVKNIQIYCVHISGKWIYKFYPKVKISTWWISQLGIGVLINSVKKAIINRKKQWIILRCWDILHDIDDIVQTLNLINFSILSIHVHRFCVPLSILYQL